MKQAVKRRAIQVDPTPFIDDDLRFHQLRQRPRTASNAVVVFALDVSASMTAVERKLAKTFFFFRAVRPSTSVPPRRGALRRAHDRGMGVSRARVLRGVGSGGTMASCAFKLVQGILDANYERPSSIHRLSLLRVGRRERDRRSPRRGVSLRKLCERLNYMGYVETRPGPRDSRRPTCGASSAS